MNGHHHLKVNNHEELMSLTSIRRNKQFNHPPLLLTRQPKQLPPRITHGWPSLADTVDAAFLMGATDACAFACKAHPCFIGRGSGLEQRRATKLAEHQPIFDGRPHAGFCASTGQRFPVQAAGGSNWMID
jgi:hypothetical protein